MKQKSKAGKILESLNKALKARVNEEFTSEDESKLKKELIKWLKKYQRADYVQPICLEMQYPENKFHIADKIIKLFPGLSYELRERNWVSFYLEWGDLGPDYAEFSDFVVKACKTALNTTGELGGANLSTYIRGWRRPHVELRSWNQQFNMPLDGLVAEK